jgi:hypothetical protein
MRDEDDEMDDEVGRTAAQKRKDKKKFDVGKQRYGKGNIQETSAFAGGPPSQFIAAEEDNWSIPASLFDEGEKVASPTSVSHGEELMTETACIVVDLAKSVHSDSKAVGDGPFGNPSPLLFGKELMPNLSSSQAQPPVWDAQSSEDRDQAIIKNMKNEIKQWNKQTLDGMEAPHPEPDAYYARKLLKEQAPAPAPTPAPTPIYVAMPGKGWPVPMAMQ